jgi:hypothetical protein
LHRNRAVLWELWHGSEVCNAAKVAGLQLGRSVWYAQLHCEDYGFRKPCKRVDMCDRRLEFIRKGVTSVKHALETVRASLAAVDDMYWQSWRTTAKDPCTSPTPKEVIDFNKSQAAQSSEQRRALGISACLKLHAAEVDAQHVLNQQVQIVQLLPVFQRAYAMARRLVWVCTRTGIGRC